MNYKLFLPLVFLLLIGCNKDDDCPHETHLDNDELSIEAKTFNPYLTSNKTVFFTDENNQEIKFEIERNLVNTSTNHISGFCYDGEYYKLYLKGIDMNLFFHIWISDIPKPNLNSATGENLKIFSSETEDSDGVINIDELCLEHSINVLNELGEPMFVENTKLIDSLSLSGKTYLNVIQNNDSDLDPEYEVFYNTEFGLIGFKNSLTNKIYNLDRIE